MRVSVDLGTTVLSSIHMSRHQLLDDSLAYTFHARTAVVSRWLVGWLVILGFNVTLTAKVISWRLVTQMFPGSLTPVLTQLFFPKPLTTFLTCFCRSERRKYAQKKVRLIRGSNLQPPGHESDTLTTELPG